MKNREHIQFLLEQYMQERASEAEREELFEALNQEQADEEWISLLQELAMKTNAAAVYPKDYWDDMITAMFERQEQGKPQKNRLFRFWRMAAAVLILIAGSGIYFFFNQKNIQKAKADIAPGGNKAILKLANGTQLILDSAQHGMLTRQGNTQVIKTDSGQLSYLPTVKSQLPTEYNTLTTPRGGQYQLILPDGSKVWLNAASSITYPVAFNGKSREVTVSGEVYFEIAHNDAQPFVVKVNDIEVRDIGTHFSISAYEDETGIRTSLLEGKIKIMINGDANNKEYLLEPGQQADINQGKVNIIRGADLEKTVAWVNNEFYFENDDLHAIMRQLSRWYDAEIKYNGPVNSHYTGRITRTVPMRQVLAMFENLGHIQFEIKGKTVTVTETKRQE